MTLPRWSTVTLGPIATTDATPRDLVNVELAADSTAERITTTVEAVDDATGNSSVWQQSYVLAAPPTGGATLDPLSDEHTTTAPAASAWQLVIALGPKPYQFKVTATGAVATALRWTLVNRVAANAPPRSP